MLRTIKINDTQELQLNNNVGWLFAYKNQCGKDFMYTLMPLVLGIVDLLSQIAAQTGDAKQIGLKELANLDSETKTEIFLKLSALEITDFIEITWAMAKVVDNDIPEPEVWASQFDPFPLDTIVPAVAELILKGLSSSKNLTRLQTMFKLQPEEKAKK